MFGDSRSVTSLILSLALISAISPVYAQGKKQISIEIRNVVKNDNYSRKSSDGKSRFFHINFQFICNGTDAGKFSNLEAVLETVNTDGARSRAIKGIQDGTSNTLREERIEIQAPEGVFARDFTLTLKGKWRVGNETKLVELSAVRKGSFPLPANFVERKK